MMRRLLIALMALMLIGGVAGVARAGQDDRGGGEAAAEVRDGSKGPKKGNCADGVDNDEDGKIDAADPGCQKPGCEPSGTQPKKCQENSDTVDPCAGIGDDDGDAHCNDDDNCPNVENDDQADEDDDGIGDACDSCDGDNVDTDGDGICDDEDACPNDAQNDVDSDGVCGDEDNCPADANADQADGDDDGLGDACDRCPQGGADPDGDGICGDDDNCPLIPNPEQQDSDDDGVGDACEPPPPPVDLCTAGTGDPGLITEHTLGQTLWNAGLQLSPLTEDPEADGPLSGAIYGGGTGTPLEVVTDELGCAVDLLFDAAALGADL